MPKRPRSAQSAVEVLLMMPILMMVFMAMYYLWSITFAAQNCHLRAREFALHGNTYLGDRSHGTRGDSALRSTDYQKAERGLQSFEFSGTASDTSIPGTGTRGQRISVTAVITSN